MKSISFPIKRNLVWFVGTPGEAAAEAHLPPRTAHVEVMAGIEARRKTGKDGPMACVFTETGLIAWLTEHDLETALQHVRKLKGTP